MQLLIAIINEEDTVDDILAAFVELGITGATVIASKGMGRVLSTQVPIFAGVRTLSARSRAGNQTVLCVADDDKVEAAIAMIEEISGGMEAPGAGIVFTVPVSRVLGMSPELNE